MVAKRGIMFEFDTSIAPGAEKALAAIEKRVEALQKRMHMTLDVTERGRRMGGGGANGAYTNGGSNGNGSVAASNAAARAAEKAAQARERAAERGMRTEARWNRMAEAAVAKREAAEKRAADRAGREAQRAADKTAREAKRAADADSREAARVTRERQRELDRQIKADKKFWDEAVQQARAGARARADAIAEAAREDARGWRNLSAMGKASFTGNRKVTAGFDALSDIGRSAMPRDAFAEGLQKMKAAQDMRSGWAGLGANAADTQQRLNSLRAMAKKDDEERKRALEANKGQLREINSAAYDVVHAFGQLTRAAAQFGLVGQRDMMKVLDTIFAVEGGINALQGGMNAFRAIKSIREARAGMGAGAGAAKYAAGLARLGGSVAGTGGAGTAAAGAGGVGLGSIGLAGAGVTALAAGGVGLLGTIADRRRGVPGQVGGFWDTVGTRLASNSSRVTGYGLRAFGGLEAAFSSPYGLTSRERELRTEGVLERTANSGLGSLLFGATGQHALSEMRIGRQERFTSEEIERRAAMRDLRSRQFAEVGSREAEQRQIRREAAEQQHAIRSGNIQARGQNIAGQLGVAFGRQQEFHGELAGLRARQAAGEFVDPAQMARAVAEQAREEGLVTSLAQRQRGNLAMAQIANLQRGRQLSQDLGAARQRQAGLGEFDTAEKEGVAREILGIQEEIKKVTEEEVHLAAQRRQLDIDGAQRTLALRERDVAVAKQAAQAMRNQRQSAIERFGNLNPMQRRATLEAARMFKQGIELQEPQLDLLRPFEAFAPQLRERAERKFKEEGGEEFLRLSGLNQRTAAAEAREKQEIDLSVNARNEIAIKLDANTDAMSKALEERIVPIFKSVMQEAINAIEVRLNMAKGTDFSHAVERANSAGGP